MENFYSSVAPVIEEAGVELARNFGKVEAIGFKAASFGSAVTELDQKTEHFIAERLHALYPAIEFFGEEFGGNNTANRFWLVDPIDGTGNFIRGIPFSTTMIELIQEGEAVFSLIYNFVTKEMYSAAKGEGAKLNGAGIHISNRSLKESNIYFETNRRKAENLKRFLDITNKYGLLANHASGFEFCQVAGGRMEARVCFDGFGEDWDFAPGALLVMEAGGIVRNIGSDTYDYRDHNFIAGTPLIYEDLKNFF